MIKSQRQAPPGAFFISLSAIIMHMTVEQSAHKPLIEGAHMRCPRCLELFPLLAWRPLQEIEAYVKETTPIYKCRRNMVSVQGKNGCGFLFAPVDYSPGRHYEDDEVLKNFMEQEVS